ncbi:MAG: hypothetical protein JJV99_12760, partial [Colwellia sp.]|nr:hypothetical protein [Colwellia sp.]
LLGQLAFVHYISGVVYELNNEADNALVSYRLAYNLLRDRGEVIPLALKISLAKLSYSLGLNSEYADYKSQFSFDIDNLNYFGNQQQFVFYFDDVISQMKESRLSLWYAPDDVYLSITVPRYEHSQYSEKVAKLDVSSMHLKTETIELLEDRVREDLTDRMPEITSTALVRASAKYALVNNMNQQDPILGAFANVFTLMSEVADLRHWTLLPAGIQIARFSFDMNSDMDSDMNSDVDSDTSHFDLSSYKATQAITTVENTRQIVFVSSLTEKVFTATFSDN